MRDVESNVSYHAIQIFSDLWNTINIGEIAENITDVKDFESIEKSYLLPYCSKADFLEDGGFICLCSKSWRNLNCDNSSLSSSCPPLEDPPQEG